MSNTFTHTDLQTFMEQQGIRGEVLLLDTPTLTVDAAAQALGVPPQQIVKSVLFSLPDASLLTISCGDQLVERRVLAARFDISRKRVRLASPEMVLALTGYPVGSVPPFGHRKHLQTLIDPRVLALSQVYAGGGSHNALVRLDPQDIVQITQAEVVDLHTCPA